MDLHQVRIIALILFLTFLSGWADSRGFIHAANIWEQGRLVTSELAKSAFGYAIGIITYWIVIRYLKEFGIVSPEIQTIGWFTVAIIGVAIASGKFMQWQAVDQIIAILVFLGVGWLIFRVG
jgi:hypothetical protein